MADAGRYTFRGLLTAFVVAAATLCCVVIANLRPAADIDKRGGRVLATAVASRASAGAARPVTNFFGYNNGAHELTSVSLSDPAYQRAMAQQKLSTYRYVA